MYDAIVVGARCAGAPTAMLLARRGHRVLLVDRATFPSEIPHGHFIWRHGRRYLRDWGLLDRLAADRCPPATSMIVDYGDFPLAARDLWADGLPVGWGPRRAALDHALVEAAVAAGAELREGFAVEEFVADDGRIAGIRGRDRRGGAMVAERATVTVGADGRHSRLARAVAAPEYEAAPTAACWYFSYWSGAAVIGLEVYARPDCVILAFPTNDGLCGIFIGWAIGRLPVVRADIERAFIAAVDTAPDLAERLRAGRREERFYGATDLPNFFRTPYGPGWALVGDAGYHKDPYMALGVADAFRDADLLATALDEGLRGCRPLDAALADYERRRNEASANDYRANLERAHFAPLPPDLLRLRAAVRGDEALTRQMALATQGMIPREAFFNPQNMQRLLAGAAAGAR